MKTTTSDSKAPHFLNPYILTLQKRITGFTNGKVPDEGLNYSVIVLFIPSRTSEISNYYSKNLSKLEDVSPQEFKSILNDYYQFIAFNKQSSDRFSQTYFKDLRLLKMLKSFVFSKDKKQIQKIAINFDKLLKN